jgi:hypothetical protein
MASTPRASRAYRRLPLPILALAFGLAATAPTPSFAQSMEVVQGPGAANYRLAARFAPYKIRELVKSTTVTPRWINHGDRFWYEWETTEGKFFYQVDPARGTKGQIFDNDRIAAELTRLTQDPWDGQHLPIRNIRFLNDNTLQFEVQSSQDDTVKVEATDTLQQQQGDRTQGKPRTKKKVFHFEYDVSTRALRLLEDYEAPDNHPSWAGVSPDSSWVVFSREFNLWAITWDEYQKVLDARRGKSGAEADSADMKLELEETQLTTDGEKDYGYGNQGRGDNDDETAKEFKKRQRAGISWSHDARYFALTR